jgi:hypothetical protein
MPAAMHRGFIRKGITAELSAEVFKVFNILTLLVIIIFFMTAGAQ